MISSVTSILVVTLISVTLLSPLGIPIIWRWCRSTDQSTTLSLLLLIPVLGLCVLLLVLKKSSSNVGE